MKLNKYDFIVLSAVIAGLVLMLFSICGCVRPVYMDPEHSMQFTQFAAAVKDWDNRCQADPNTCAESLHSMALRMKEWHVIVTGIDPNEVTP
jgi:hypothetical protein